MLYWWLCCYFAAFSVNLAALIVALCFFGWGPLYAWVYVLTSLPIFLAILMICMETLSTREHKARAIVIGFILALTVGHLTHAGIARPLTVYDWITLTEGVLLVWAGIVAGFSAAYAEHRDIVLTLAVLWLCQALFSLGYVLHWNFPDWLWMNFWVPQTTCLAAFSLIGFLMRRQPGPRQLSAHLL